jgi:hypothetical protein
MRVLLVSTNTERLNMPTVPLRLGFVASAARRAGHDVEFLDLMFKDDPRVLLAKRIALAEGMITSEDELLKPQFYLAPEIAPWIRSVVKAGFREKIKPAHFTNRKHLSA